MRPRRGGASRIPRRCRPRRADRHHRRAPREGAVAAAGSRSAHGSHRLPGRDSVDARLRRPAGDHEWIEYPATRPDQVVERLLGAQIAITNKAPMPAAVIDALPDPRLVAISATGTNVVDLEACRRRGLPCAISAATRCHRSRAHP